MPRQQYVAIGNRTLRLVIAFTLQVQTSRLFTTIEQLLLIFYYESIHIYYNERR